MSAEQAVPGSDVEKAPSLSPTRRPLRRFWQRVSAPWRPDRRRRTIFTLASIALAVVAVVGGSITLGWWWAASTLAASTDSASPQVIEVPVSSLADGAQMPDVRGLRPATAQQVLADAGLPVQEVEFVERPAAGPSGLVVEQNPVFGTLDPIDIVITVSAPAVLADYVGGDAGRALEELLELGAAVEVVEIYRPGDVIGVVLATEPVAGEIVPSSVVLQVTSQPAAVTMADLERSSGCSDAGTVELGGDDLVDSLSCAAPANGRSVTWTVDGAVDRFTAVLALENGTPSGTRVSVVVLAGNDPVGTWDLDTRAVVRVDVVTTGARQITLRFVGIVQPGADVVVGSPTGYGAPEAIRELLRG